jgi:hypothetical protein
MLGPNPTFLDPQTPHDHTNLDGFLLEYHFQGQLFHVVEKSPFLCKCFGIVVQRRLDFVVHMFVLFQIRDVLLAAHLEFHGHGAVLIFHFARILVSHSYFRTVGRNVGQTVGRNVLKWDKQRAEMCQNGTKHWAEMCQNGTNSGLKCVEMG